MITDKQLREAAGEAEEYLLSHLPEPAEPHTFSPGFERKMKRLMARAEHPVRYRAMRYAAAALLVVVTVFGGVLAVSPEVRAEVGSWFKGDAFISSPSGKVPVAERKDFCLTWIPEGYTYYDVMETSFGKTYFYIDENDRFLRFIYLYDGKSYAMVEGYEHKQVLLGDVQADIFLDPTGEHSNEIIWKDPNGDVCFIISAFMEEEQLIRLALSVKEKK